ncbi:hypothetical protein ERO13_D02G069350v2 [Gossypium hirsutum]|nr:hypothetical protein ERO13_D02G069350v2 [Gossypium hirsutum]
MADEREGAKSIDYVPEEKGEEKIESKKTKPDIDGQSPDGRKEKRGGALKEKFFCYIYLKKTIINLYFPIEVIMENMISLGSENQEGFLLFFYKENPEDFLHEQLRVFFPHN